MAILKSVLPANLIKHINEDTYFGQTKVNQEIMKYLDTFPIFLNVFATKKTKPSYKCGIFQYLPYTCLGLFISFFQIKLSQSLSTNISNFHFIITSCLCISLFMLYFSTISILFFMQIIKVRHSLSFWGWITFRVCNHQTKNRNQKAKIYVDHFQINRRSAGPHRRIFQLKHQTNH